jgi:hypothetical protein
VPTAVSSAVPLRSTTALVEELWDADEPLGEFPPPMEPAIAAPIGRWSWLRVVVTIIVLGAAGIGAHVGTTYLLDARADDIVLGAEATLAEVRDHARTVEAAAAAIADPAADDVALSAASSVITELEADARALGALAEPDPGWPELVGLEVVDPVAGWRSAAFVVGGRANALADQFSSALTTRLLIRQVAPLPDLPNGADDATIDDLETALTAAISGIRGDIDRYDGDLAADVVPVLDGWEEATTAYIGALRGHSPDAEAFAGEVVAAREVLDSVFTAWVERLGPGLTEAAARYRVAVGSIG